MYKTNTGKYCYHCGADIHTHSELYGRELIWNDECSENCVSELSVNQLKSDLNTAIKKVEAIKQSIKIASSYRTNEAKLADAIRKTEALAKECGVPIGQLASNLGRK